MLSHPFPLLARLLVGINKVCGSWRCSYSHLIKWLRSSSTQGFRLLPHTETNGLSADVSREHRNVFASIPQNNFSSEPLLCIFDAVVQIWLRPHVSFSVIHMQQTPTPEHLSRECKCIVCIFNSTPLHSCCLNRNFPDIAAGRTSNKHSGCMFTARHSKTKKDKVTSIM